MTADARTVGLRDVLIDLRRARAALCRGEIGHAILNWGAAKHALGHTIGNCDLHGRRASMAAELLRKASIRLGERLVRAAQPDPAPAYDVAAVVAQCLTVLRTRDGLDVDEALIRDRAANAAMGLVGAFDIRVWPARSAAADYVRRKK